jgi:general secretion pathway protein A
MYLQFFGLKETPFSLTPDPAFVYLSAAHRDALAHLLYGVGQGGAGGFVQLTGEVGTGKTTICRCLLEQVPEETQVALVLNPLMTPRELLATICEELGIETADISDSNKLMVDALNKYLLEQHAGGRHVVVVIDEAQNLSPEALEQVRLLTNLETAKEKLLQMVLLGQPELRQLLQRQNLRQLSQRITARYHLAPLNQEETLAYVKHRMQVAGAQRNPFRRSAMRALYQRSGGVPRLINIIADRSLAGAYAGESGNVTPAMVNAAANEVQPSETRVRSSRWPVVVATASAAMVVLLSLVMWGSPVLDSLRPAPVEEPLEIAQSEPIPAPAKPVQETARQVEQAREDPPVGAYSGDLIPAEPVMLSRIDKDWLEEQHRLVWQSVAELWQDDASASAIVSACNGASGTGYACLRDQGNWSRIRKLGLPVILVLQDDSSRLLVLHGFSREGLLVGSGDDVIEVSLDAVEDQWLGEYIIAWPQAPDWPGQISRGESGAAVDIVMDMAGLAEPAWIGSGIFDANFESWLMTFQRQHGLKADGIVGPNTLIYLMAPTITQPRLIVAAEEKS